MSRCVQVSWHTDYLSITKLAMGLAYRLTNQVRMSFKLGSMEAEKQEDLNKSQERIIIWGVLKGCRGKLAEQSASHLRCLYDNAGSLSTNTQK